MIGRGQDLKESRRKIVQQNEWWSEVMSNVADTRRFYLHKLCLSVIAPVTRSRGDQSLSGDTTPSRFSRPYLRAVPPDDAPKNSKDPHARTVGNRHMHAEI